MAGERRIGRLNGLFGFGSERFFFVSPSSVVLCARFLPVLLVVRLDDLDDLDASASLSPGTPPRPGSVIPLLGRRFALLVNSL